MWRFKIKEEFQEIGRWEEEYGCPKGWSSKGYMNDYMGKLIPHKYYEECKQGRSFHLDSWYFTKRDYTNVDIVYEIY